jgi:hypothetical protein
MMCRFRRAPLLQVPFAQFQAARAVLKIDMDMTPKSRRSRGDVPRQSFRRRRVGRIAPKLPDFRAAAHGPAVGRDRPDAEEATAGREPCRAAPSGRRAGLAAKVGRAKPERRKQTAQIPRPNVPWQRHRRNGEGQGHKRQQRPGETPRVCDQRLGASKISIHNQFQLPASGHASSIL